MFFRNSVNPRSLEVCVKKNVYIHILILNYIRLKKMWFNYDLNTSGSI